MLIKRTERSAGSIIVEAACTVPVFIIALCAVLMLIAQTGIEDTVFYYMHKAANNTCSVIAASDTAQGELNTVPEKASAYSGFAMSLRNGIAEEWNSSSAPSVHLASLDFDTEVTLSDGTHIDRLICAEVKFEHRLPVLGGFNNKARSSRYLVFRPWVGESVQDAEFDDTQVFIFPKRGEHYHNINCSCLKNGEIQVVLNKTVRKKYKGCTTCHAGELPDGSPVFLMSQGSEAFHRKSCPCITKAFECIALSDAVSMGYSSCSLCGGTPGSYDPSSDLFK